MATFRAALVLDIRQHRLAWSAILAGLAACAMLWGSILGVPLARRAPYELPPAGAPLPSFVDDIEHPIEFGPPE